MFIKTCYFREFEVPSLPISTGKLVNPRLFFSGSFQGRIRSGIGLSILPSSKLSKSYVYMIK